MDPGFLLGVDIGTTTIKTVLIDRDGTERAHAARPTPLRRRGDRAEMTVDELTGAVARTIADLGDATASVRAVGFTGMGESGAPLDGGLEPLAPVIAWHDPRGADEAALLARYLPGLHLRTGRPTSAVSSVAKLAWLVRSGMEHPLHWVGVPELCVLAATGELVTDFSLASRTGAFDVARHIYLDEPGDLLGIEVSAFLEPLAAGRIAGFVTAEGADDLGVPMGVPVTVAGHDHLVGATTIAPARHVLSNSVGTAETVLVHLDALPSLERAHDLNVHVSAAPSGRGWIAFASATRTGLVRAAAASALGIGVHDLDEAAVGVAPTEARLFLEELEAGECPPARVRPQESGARPSRASGAPDDGAPDDPRSSPSGAPEEIWAGVLDALAGRTRAAADRLARASGAYERIVVFGGGARSPAWLTAKARRFEVAVERALTTEAVARGAAIYAGVAAGWWESVADAPRPRSERVSPT